MLAINRTFACALAATLLLAACSKQPTNESSASLASSAATSSALPDSLKITSWGPDSTKAGEVFNKQPDGSAALWIRLDHSLSGDIAAIEFNGVLLQGAVSGNLVTARVPTDLYAKSGNYKVDVIARMGGRTLQSNTVTFTVQ